MGGCRAAEAASRTLVTTCNKRYSPPYAEARRLLGFGELPRPSLFAAKFTLGYGDVDLLAAGTVHVFDLALEWTLEQRNSSQLGAEY